VRREGYYEMIFAMTNELKNMNGRQDKDREELSGKNTK